ncbi:NCS2 family permease [Marinactinospora thermotolerans]|uniref:Putative MFS transporter, AGZA family, xanthine/uracil permease n=1 Tax=Marinactinospora thermotolerans DSM 45154 TaxID=1122192 RepID=A0A1T4NR20_9ACTN|nr:NCS2 family permease [Marinactinospora thermotolerans]SJZ81654.1 putative MFS transporter, AGZA family, xanthine/uracil permease [Marinactinospora thermotolerans DSM 45154]
MKTPDTAGPASPAHSDRSWLDRYFSISGRGSTLPRELRGGLTTFMAMAYIIVLNPIILGGAQDVNGDVLSPAQLTTMTCLSAGVVTVVMGLVGRAPIALAAALGTTPVVAYQAAPLMTWPEAMGLVVWQGVVVILLVVTGLRSMIMDAIPRNLNLAIGVGIGLFVTLIALKDAGFLSAGAEGGTLLQLGTVGHLVGWPVAVFIVSFLVAAVLVSREVPGAILIGILTGTVMAVTVHHVFDIDPAAWGLQVPQIPESVVGAPDFGLLFQVDLFGAWTSAGAVSAGIILFTLVLAGFFDALGTCLAIGEKAGLTDERGRMPHINKILAIDGVGAIAGGATSSSATLIFVESTAGVTEGARTGIASLVTGGLFLLALFLTPLTGIVPQQAAACALVLVGAMMMMQIGKIAWNDVTVAIPAFLTIVLMPFTYNIANGIGAGIITYTLLTSLTGRHREVHWLMWVLSAVFVFHFAIGAAGPLLG